MGIDIYRLSTNKRLAVTTVDGDLVRPYVYGQKVTYNWDYERQQQQWIERCHERCPDGGGFVTIPADWNGKVADGDPVYYMPTLSGIWYDCDAYPGGCVGFLRKVGRGKWDIVSQAAVVEERTRVLVAALPTSRRFAAQESSDVAQEAIEQANTVIHSYLRDGVLHVNELSERVRAIYDARNSLRAAQAGSGYL